MAGRDTERARRYGTVTVVLVAVAALGLAMTGTVLVGQALDGAGESDVMGPGDPSGIGSAAVVSSAAGGPGADAGPSAPIGIAAAAAPPTSSAAATPPSNSGAGEPTARVTTQCLGDQTNRLHVDAWNLSGENVTVAFDSTNDSADFTATVRPDANGTVAEEYDVTDESDLTVTVHLGDDTSGAVLASERFDSGACDVFDGTPSVEAARLDAGCDDGDRRLTLKNRNDGADLEVVVTDETGGEVLNETLEAASTEVLGGLANGTYTVVTRFRGEQLASEQISVCCATDPGDEPGGAKGDSPTATVTTQCLGDRTNRLHVDAADLGDSNVTVDVDSSNDSADFQRTLQPDASGTVETEFEVSDEENVTVTVHLGDDTSGPVLASERFEVGTCNAIGDDVPVESARLTTDCDDGQGELTMKNRNDGSDLRVVVTDASGTEVLNTTLAPATTETLDGLSNGTYTVVSLFRGEELESEQVQISCPGS